jgi:tropomyosin, fungi type
MAFRLRQTDIKAGHYERKVQALQNEVEAWEKKYDDLSLKHKQVEKDLADFQAEIAGL